MVFVNPIKYKEVRDTGFGLSAVARGTGIFLENLELYSQFLEGGEDLG